MDVTGMSALPPTPAALVAAIKRACERPLTKAERREQRLSFVMGQLPEGNTLTRDEVRVILDRFDGIPTAPPPARIRPMSTDRGRLAYETRWEGHTLGRCGAAPAWDDLGEEGQAVWRRIAEKLDAAGPPPALPELVEAATYLAARDAMCPPEGVPLNEWLPAVTGARAALKPNHPPPSTDDQTARFLAESNAIEREEALRQENRRLRIAFHDAIRRPLGVTPDSAAEFYDQRMVDEAEARRADGGRL